MLQDAFGLFELYAQSVEMNDNVTKMATDMLRSLNFPAKLIEKPQGGSNNPTSLYVLVGSIRFYLLMFCLKTAPQLDVVSSAPLLNSVDIFCPLFCAVHCELESVELEGFGTFLGVVKYPLVERGVRIVSGKNMDSMGADSNGAGKTTLVMAPLWALTGTSWKM